MQCLQGAYLLQIMLKILTCMFHLSQGDNEDTAGQSLTYAEVEGWQEINTLQQLPCKGFGTSLPYPNMPFPHVFAVIHLLLLPLSLVVVG